MAPTGADVANRALAVRGDLVLVGAQEGLMPSTSALLARLAWRCSPQTSGLPTTRTLKNTLAGSSETFAAATTEVIS